MSAGRFEDCTPCIGYCSTSLGDAVCRGCGRTAEEVDGWLLLDEAQQRLVWERVNGMDTIRNRRAGQGRPTVPQGSD